jgi:hypothetical protein
VLWRRGPADQVQPVDAGVGVQPLRRGDGDLARAAEQHRRVAVRPGRRLLVVGCHVRQVQVSVEDGAAKERVSVGQQGTHVPGQRGGVEPGVDGERECADPAPLGRGDPGERGRHRTGGEHAGCVAVQDRVRRDDYDVRQVGVLLSRPQDVQQGDGEPLRLRRVEHGGRVEPHDRGAGVGQPGQPVPDVGAERQVEHDRVGLGATARVRAHEQPLVGDRVLDRQLVAGTQHVDVSEPGRQQVPPRRQRQQGVVGA